MVRIIVSAFFTWFLSLAALAHEVTIVELVVNDELNKELQGYHGPLSGITGFIIDDTRLELNGKITAYDLQDEQPESDLEYIARRIWDIFLRRFNTKPKLPCGIIAHGKVSINTDSKDFISIYGLGDGFFDSCEKINTPGLWCFNIYVWRDKTDGKYVFQLSSYSQ
jgi:hypothetical protein